jgi:hypothetical protein
MAFMAITDANFDTERELQDWVVQNLCQFLPNVIHLPAFQITTISGKSGVPDGFAFNFHEKRWYVIEHELLNHGVWPHIAEQITRFVVALQNKETHRKIRDRVFEYVMASGSINSIAQDLETTPERILQQIELFIEGVKPELTIFIDETNQDLVDMVHALAVPTQIFRVKKFVVNGTPEYYSPDSNAPAIVSEPEIDSLVGDSEFELVQTLGGGKLEARVGRFRCYRLDKGDIINIKRSKYHESNNYYWYGISTSSLKYVEEYSVTHIVFVMGEEGFVKIPMQLIQEFLDITKVSRNEDGSIRHFHCLISPGPNPELYWSNDTQRFALSELYTSFSA